MTATPLIARRAGGYINFSLSKPHVLLILQIAQPPLVPMRRLALLVVRFLMNFMLDVNVDLQRLHARPRLS